MVINRSRARVVLTNLFPGALEWNELPAKYRRREIDQSECDVINNGGADRPWQ